MNQTPSVMAQSLRPSELQIAKENIARDLDTYVRAMTPGVPIDSRQGGEMQRLLWRCIKNCTRYEGPVFAACWSLLLETVAAHRKTADGRPGVFGGANPFRFPETTPLSPEERSSLHRIVLLLTMTCEPSTRLLKIRHIDLPAAVSGLDGVAAERIKAYYTDY